MFEQTKSHLKMSKYELSKLSEKTEKKRSDVRKFPIYTYMSLLGPFKKVQSDAQSIFVVQIRSKALKPS